MFKEFFGDAFDIIQKAAPAIASAIGSPAAGAATMIGLNLLGNAFGINPTQVKELKDEIVSNPRSPEIISGLNEKFADWFKANSGELKMPSTFELNLKIGWPSANGVN